MVGEAEYAFKHALTREVAYAGLLKAKRARLHAEFAGWLERFGDDRDDLAPFLGHHYAEAAQPEDADLAWAERRGSSLSAELSTGYVAPQSLRSDATTSTRRCGSWLVQPT